MTGQDPWDYAGEIKEPTLLEKVIVLIMVIISTLFFRSPKRK